MSKVSGYNRGIMMLMMGVVALFISFSALASPITVKDMAGRTVTFDKIPTRVALQDGRVGFDFALLFHGTDPFSRIVVWNNLIRRQLPGFWNLMSQKWPDTAKIPDMVFGDNGQVNVEQLIARHPQVLIAELRARPVLEQSNAVTQLAAAGIKVVYVDDAVNPVPNAAKSLLLLGKLFGKEKEAQAYYDFYQQHLNALNKAIAQQPTPHPLVFVEALAGQNDANNCCFTHGNFGWGKLVQAVKARNLGSQILHSPSGIVSAETLLANQPDVFIMTGRAPSNVMPELGFNVTPKNINERMQSLMQRPGLAELNTVQNGRVYGIYHPFYSSVLNIVGLEYLAKDVYPKAFTSLDPGHTFQQILAQFTDLPKGNAILGMQLQK